MYRSVLQGALIASPGPTGVVVDGVVVIEDGRIVEVGTRHYPRSPEVIDCGDRVLMPGLCNAHVHSEFLLFKGLLEDQRLHAWDAAPFYEPGWTRLEDPLDAELLLPAWRASYLEQVLSGITFIGEFNCVNGSAPLSEAVLEEVGVRGAATFKAHEPRPSSSAVPIYYLHHERNVTAEELADASALMRAEPEARITLHAAETAERMAIVRERFGTTTIRLLERYGLLSPRTLLSHAVHVDDEEVEILARHGAWVVASPTAEMKLADGISPIVKYLEAGVPVCLGTDCATCNNGVDLFGEMKALGLLHKLTSGAHVLPAEALLALGTREGMRAFGLADAGAVEPGFRADLILLDRWAPSLNPMVHRAGMSNVFANLVYGATGRDVLDVMVGGEWIVRERQHRSLRLEPVTRALQAAADVLWAAW
jgi:5-methylthioadenosine/S-adenosylhomocysteine deaminase